MGAPHPLRRAGRALVHLGLSGWLFVAAGCTLLVGVDGEEGDAPGEALPARGRDVAGDAGLAVRDPGGGGRDDDGGVAIADGGPDAGPGEDAGVVVDAGGTDPGEVWTPGPNALDQDALFTCQGEPASSPSRLRRVERREWTHTVVKPLSGTWWGSVAKDNPFDAPGSLPYSTYAGEVTVDETTLDLYFAVLPEAGAGWVARSGGAGGVRTYTVYNDPELGCVWSDALPDETCTTYFVDKLLREAVLFRPPTAGELERLHAFLLEALASEVDPEAEREATLSQVTQAAWLMAGALFKSELGEADDDDPTDGRHRLSSHELARALGGVLSTFAPGVSGVWTYQEGPPAHPNWSAPPEGYLGALAAAADDGTIQDPAVLSALLAAYVGGTDPARYDLQLDKDGDRRALRGEYWLAPRVRDFFREWLGYEEVRSIFKDTPRKTSQWDGEYTGDPMYDPITLAWGNLLNGSYGDESLLDEQLDDTIARVVVEDVDVLRNLLTTRTWRLPSNLSQTNGQACSSDADCSGGFGRCTDRGVCGTSIWKSTTQTHRPYNLTEDVPNTPEGRWVEMPAGERAGVLTHPAWLAAHGGNFEDDASLVHRGKWIRENLFCEVVPPLELVMVEAKLVPSAPDKSARDRVVESIETGPDAPTCMGCHSQMNSLGYPFEIYNHAGFVRANDHGSPPDGSSVIVNAPDPSLNTTIQDAVQLSELLAESGHVKRCFIRQAFRFFMGRDETPADGCALSAMEAAYDEQGSFIAMLDALVTSDTFLYRHHEAGDAP